MKPYPKIRQTAALNPSGSWVLTEKIHGANLSFGFSEGKLCLYKRKAQLSPQEYPQFFNVQQLLPALTVACHRIADLFGHENWTVYGEIAGGAYPGAGGGAPVQSGVYYSPHLIFVAFDILEHQRWLGYDRFVQTCQHADLLFAPLLGRGSYNQLIKQPANFPSQIPFRLGLPNIEGNLAEGWVLKPSSSWDYQTRPALKKKTERFSEVSGPAPQFTSNDILVVCAQATELITPARIASAKSKIGNNWLQIRAEVADDILQEIQEQTPLSKQDQLTVKLTVLSVVDELSTIF